MGPVLEVRDLAVERGKDMVLEGVEFTVEEGDYVGIVGPNGGGKTTLLGCKIGALNRLPASFFVSISYMCWAYRRRGALFSSVGKVTRWLYQ